jgi:hypothetical protein
MLNERITRPKCCFADANVLPLDMEPQQVILGQSESTDRCLGFQASTEPVLIVAMKPDRELCVSDNGMGIGFG